MPVNHSLAVVFMTGSIKNKIPLIAAAILTATILSCNSTYGLNPLSQLPPANPSTPQPEDSSNGLQSAETSTAFQPSPPPATPAPLIVWLSPDLPEALRVPFDALESLGTRAVQFTADPAEAQLRFEEHGEETTSAWVYALTAAFPAPIDELSGAEWDAIWSGESETAQRLIVAPHVFEILQKTFGNPQDSAPIELSEGDLLAEAWDDYARIALIPFDELTPRWKVLGVDGQDLFDPEFDPEAYLFTISFGFSGDLELVPEILGQVELPRQNFERQSLSIVAMTGVTALTRSTAWAMYSNGIEYPAEKIGDWFRDADIVHVSNEVSFWDGCPAPTPARVGLTFCSDPSYLGLFEAIGVDVIELTGNHLKDFGTDPLVETLEYFREAGFEYFGGGDNLESSLNPVLIEHHGNQFAFLGCNRPGPPGVFASESSPGAAPCDWEVLLPLITDLRNTGYLPIFTFQWYEYYQNTPTSAQVEAFQQVVEAGAVVVSGSQAHQPQSLEFYQDALIHYGLGNLFFDQMWSLYTRQEFVDHHIFYDGRHIGTRLLTAMLEDFSQPRPMDEIERGVFLQTIFSASGW
jgi:hypothetical protein